MISAQDTVIRLLAAVLFCGAVGLQRALSGKAAGMRTHILVGVGAALFAIISNHAYPTAMANADRIASNVVTGIGFIGGGAILKERGAIKGLTTAAGLWASAALGLAAGTGLYVLGASGAAIILFALIALRHVEKRFPRRALEVWTIGITLAGTATVEQMHEAIAPYCHSIGLITLSSDECTRLTFLVGIPHHRNLADLTAHLRAAGAGAVTWQAQAGTEGEEGP